MLRGWWADYPDPDAFGSGIFKNPQYAMCSTSSVRSLVDQARRETDPRRRQVIYAELEEQLVADRLVLPLFHTGVHYFVRSGVTGIDDAIAMTRSLDVASLAVSDE